MAADDGQQSLRIPFPLRNWQEVNRRAAELSGNVLGRLETQEASGATAARPTGLYVGQPFFDTTLGRPIWWNGTIWVDSAGTGV